MSSHILSLLGLALRGGRLAVGEEPTALAAKAGQARLLLAASDAAGNTLRRAEHLAQEGHCLWLILPFTKEELGHALGRGSAAIAAMTDTGLAAALTERLAQLDPERYAETAARMDLKRRRAKERQSAPRRDPPPARPREERRGGKAGARRPPQDGGRPPRKRAFDPPSGERSGGKTGPRSPGKNQFRGGKGRPPRDGEHGSRHPRPKTGGRGSHRGPPGESRGRGR